MVIICIFLLILRNKKYSLFQSKLAPPHTCQQCQIHPHHTAQLQEHTQQAQSKGEERSFIWSVRAQQRRGQVPYETVVKGEQENCD